MKRPAVPVWPGKPDGVFYNYNKSIPMNRDNTAFRPASAWTIAVLLAFMMLVNFLDKVAIGIAIAYWTTISVFAAMGAGGVMTPVLAAWAPNLLFGAGALYLLLTVRT